MEAIAIAALTMPERFKLARGRQGLSQGELAARARLHLMTISRIEKGQCDPTIDTVKKLARVLNVSPSWLAGFSD